MRTFLSHDATASKSAFGENARSDTPSSGGEVNSTSLLRSPWVDEFALDAVAAEFPNRDIVYECVEDGRVGGWVGGWVRCCWWEDGRRTPYNAAPCGRVKLRWMETV